MRPRGESQRNSHSKVRYAPCWREPRSIDIYRAERWSGMRLRRSNATVLAAVAASLMVVTPGDPHGQDQSTPQVLRYNGGRYDRAGAMAVDAVGAFYVGGSVELGSSQPGFAAMKVDGAGNRVWRTNYSGSAGGALGQASAVAVDPAGNVYAGGYVNVGFQSTITDALIVKFDANGVEQWARRFNGPGGGPDGVTRIAVDVLGNAYVSGDSYGTGMDWVTWKYAPDGTLLWTRRQSGSGNFDDRVVASGLDAQGDLVVTGITKNTGDSITNDVTTVKYRPDGAIVWSRTFSGTAVTDDLVFDMAIDAAGSIYLAGAIAPTADPEGPLHVPLALLYDANGSLESAVQGTSTGSGTGVAIDAAGDVYIATESALYKYDRMLTLIRTVPLAVGLQSATPVIDSRNNVLVTGTAFDRFTFVRDYYTAKFDSNGHTLWTNRFNGTGNRDDVVAAAALDSAGALLVTGTSWSNYASSGGTADDIVTLKFGASGSTPPPVPQPPSAPSGLSAVSLSRTQIQLAWTDTSSNETGFSIERCAGNNCSAFATVAQVAAGATGYVDNGLSKRTAYRYRVRAVGAAGSSAYSNIASAMTAK